MRGLGALGCGKAPATSGNACGAVGFVGTAAFFTGRAFLGANGFRPGRGAARRRRAWALGGAGFLGFPYALTTWPRRPARASTASFHAGRCFARCLSPLAKASCRSSSSSCGLSTADAMGARDSFRVRWAA